MNSPGLTAMSLLSCIYSSSIHKISSHFDTCFCRRPQVPAARCSAQAQPTHSGQLPLLLHTPHVKCTLSLTNSAFARAQQWLAKGATVVSLKWAVPLLQEQEACKGFYVYSAAALQPCLLFSSEDSASYARTLSTSLNCHDVNPVAQGSAESFFSALEVSGCFARDFLQSTTRWQHSGIGAYNIRCRLCKKAILLRVMVLWGGIFDMRCKQARATFKSQLKAH